MNEAIAWNLGTMTSIPYLIDHNICMCSNARVPFPVNDILEKILSDNDYTIWKQGGKPKTFFYNRFQYPIGRCHYNFKSNTLDPKPKINQTEQNSSETETADVHIPTTTHEFPPQITHKNKIFRIEAKYKGTAKYRCRGTRGNCSKGCTAVLNITKDLNVQWEPKHISI